MWLTAYHALIPGGWDLVVVEASDHGNRTNMPKERSELKDLPTTAYNRPSLNREHLARSSQLGYTMKSDLCN